MEVLNFFVCGPHLHKALLFPQLSREKNSSDLSYVRDLQEMKCYLDVLSPCLLPVNLRWLKNRLLNFSFPEHVTHQKQHCQAVMWPWRLLHLVNGREKQVKALTLSCDQLMATLKVIDKKSCSWCPPSLSCSAHPGDTPQGWRNLQTRAAERQPGRRQKLWAGFEMQFQLFWNSFQFPDIWTTVLHITCPGPVGDRGFISEHVCPASPNPHKGSQKSLPQLCTYATSRIFAHCH